MDANSLETNENLKSDSYQIGNKHLHMSRTKGARMLEPRKLEKLTKPAIIGQKFALMLDNIFVNNLFPITGQPPTKFHFPVRL